MSPEKLEQIRQMAADMSDTQRMMLYEKEKKSEAVGLLLAIFFSGVGLMYVGRVGAGIVCLVLTWLMVPYLYAIWAKGVKKHNEAPSRAILQPA